MKTQASSQLSEFLSVHVPAHGIPEGLRSNMFVGPTTIKWLGCDSEENFDKRAFAHPDYGMDTKELTYRINAHGYRGAEFSESADLKVASFGCSCVFGVGVREDEVFHEIVCRHIAERTGKSVVDFNLGVCGASNDLISRLVATAVPVLQPDIVLIGFTGLMRREEVTAKGKHYNFIPRMGQYADDVPARHLEALSSPHDDIANFFRAYSTIKASLKGRFWLFSTIDEHSIEHLRTWWDEDRMVGSFKMVDFGRDYSHPGRETHANLAHDFIRAFDAKNDMAAS